MDNINKKNKYIGFTLIETLVAIFIFSLIMVAMSNIIISLYQSYNFSWQQAQAIDEAKRGTKIMVKEIREARTGADGSYPIQSAGDSEFIFYSDIDEDGMVERIRYFLGGTSERQETKICTSFVRGGSCSVVFSNFYEGTLESAQIRVSVEGDLGWNIEYVEVFAEGVKLGNFCDGWNECNDCSGSWQGTKTFDITEAAQDNYIQFNASGSWWVDPICNWEEPGHSMRVRFELVWTETTSGQDRQLKKGTIKPTGFPPTYDLGQEEIVILSHYVQNKIDDPETKLFTYFDKSGNEIIEYPARPEKTKLMGVSLIINVCPERAPRDYELTTKVRLRNLVADEE